MRGNGTGPADLSLLNIDDHVVEPPDVLEGRMPSNLAGRAPVTAQDIVHQPASAFAARAG
ncbi:MAG: hypothetical protein V3R77_01355 [Candidatus Binatia bacterium]